MNFKDYKPGMFISIPGFIVQPSYTAATFCTVEMPHQGYTTICPHVLTFTVPETFNAVKQEIDGIDKAMGQAADAYHSTIADLKQRKAELLQLTHSDSEVMDAPAANAVPQSFVDVDIDLDDDIPF